MSFERYEQSLDGKWRFIPDTEATGTESKWWKAAPDIAATEVDVPGHWSAWPTGNAEIGWLFHAFSFSPPEHPHCTRLFLDGLGRDAEIWLNGQRLGTHASALVPADFEVTTKLTSGENELAIRISGPDTNTPLRPSHAALAEAATPRQLAGLMRAATLRTFPEAHIAEIHVQSDCRRNLLNIGVAQHGGDTVRASILDTPYQIEGPEPELALPIEEYETWSPAKPKRYTLRCELLKDSAVVDVREVSFAMTEFTVKDNRFCLNNRPFWLKGVHHEVAYPLHVAQDQYNAEARREIEAARKLGFNMIFLRGGHAPEELLEAADQIGMLIALEAPAGGLEVTEALARRVRNHASLALWCAATPDHMQALRKLDPLRPILSGPGANTSATLLRPFRDTPEDYDDIQVYQGAPLPALAENYLRSVGEKSKLCLLSGFAAAGPGDVQPKALQPLLDAAREGFATHDLERGCGGFDGLLQAGQVLQRASVAAQVDAIRANPNLAGYFLRQLRDTSPEWYGLLDTAANEKPAAAAVADAQRLVRPLIRMAKTNLVLRETISVTVLLANERRLEGRADLSLQVVGPTNQVLWKKRRGVKLPKHGRLIWEGEVSASGSPGMHKFVVRVIQENRVIAQSSTAFYVVAVPEREQHPVHLLDPHGHWKALIGQFSRLDTFLAPVHIVPPLASTIAGYPDNALLQVLAQVRGGAVALIFSPPADWNALAEHLGENTSATTRLTGGYATPAWHYAKLHPVFSGLPTRGLMARPYRSIAPLHMFSESSDEDICGTFHGGEAGQQAAWGSTILVRRHGEGRLVFIHLRILENLGIDPIADQLFDNLLAHFSRRSVPSKTPLTPHAPAVEWLREERNTEARRWMVLGEFPYADGIDTPHPPETELEFDATYPGWYQAITWRPSYSRASEDHYLDLQDAFAPLYQDYPRHGSATGYAYAEFNMDRRQAAILCLSLKNATKVWLNGKELLARADAPPQGTTAEEVVPAYFRQGRNTFLIKCAKNAGPFGFALDIHGEKGEAVPVKWWR